MADNNELVTRAMQHNKAPMSLREGSIYIDGMKICDGVKAEFKLTPDVWTGRQLGEKTQSSRWLGFSITGSITRRRSTNWLAEVAQKYKDSKVTPELTIQGIMSDEGSDFYATTGGKNLVVTLMGCVLTGDLTILALDSGGNIVDDVVNFNAYDYTSKLAS